MVRRRTFRVTIIFIILLPLCVHFNLARRSFAYMVYWLRSFAQIFLIRFFISRLIFLFFLFLFFYFFFLFFKRLTYFRDFYIIFHLGCVRFLIYQRVCQAFSVEFCSVFVKLSKITVKICHGQGDAEFFARHIMVSGSVRCERCGRARWGDHPQLCADCYTRDSFPLVGPPLSLNPFERACESIYRWFTGMYDVCETVLFSEEDLDTLERTISFGWLAETVTLAQWGDARVYEDEAEFQYIAERADAAVARFEWPEDEEEYTRRFG